MGSYTKNLFKKNKPKPTMEDRIRDEELPADLTVPESENKQIAVWVDDERPPSCDPSGLDVDWVWVKSYRDLIMMLKEDPEEGEPEIEITHLSLDWYMGHRALMHGDVGVEELLNRVYYLKLPALGNTVYINCHSSDDVNAKKMARTLHERREKGQLNSKARIRMNKANDHG